MLVLTTTWLHCNNLFYWFFTTHYSIKLKTQAWLFYYSACEQSLGVTEPVLCVVWQIFTFGIRKKMLSGFGLAILKLMCAVRSCTAHLCMIYATWNIGSVGSFAIAFHKCYQHTPGQNQSHTVESASLCPWKYPASLQKSFHRKLSTWYHHISPHWYSLTLSPMTNIQ